MATPRDPAYLRHELRNALTVAMVACTRLKLTRSLAMVHDLSKVIEAELLGDADKFQPGDPR